MGSWGLCGAPGPARRAFSRVFRGFLQRPGTHRTRGSCGPEAWPLLGTPERWEAAGEAEEQGGSINVKAGLATGGVLRDAIP